MRGVIMIYDAHTCFWFPLLVHSLLYTLHVVHCTLTNTRHDTRPASACQKPAVRCPHYQSLLAITPAITPSLDP